MPPLAKSKEKVALNFQLKEIELLDSCLNHPRHEMPALNVFQFDIKLEHKTNVEKKFLAVVICIEIFNELHDTKFGSLTVSCIYKIENFNDFVDSKNNLLLPDEYLITLNSITISTARGIMFSQFKGTFLHKACLPIIDPKSFVVQK